MRRKALTAIVGGCCLIALLGTLGIWWFVNYSPWTAVQSGHLKSGISEYKGFLYEEPPTPSTSLKAEELVLKDTTSTLSAEEVVQKWMTVSDAAAEYNWQEWGLVIDADTGEELLSANANTGHTPASTAKILTSLVALNQLDSSEQLKTGISRVGQDLYLLGEGDLLLTKDDAGASISGRASLKDLAADTAEILQEEGITSVSLQYQDKLFSGDKRLKTWQEQGVADYVGDVGPYAIDTGRTASGEWSFVDDSSSRVAQAFVDLLQEQGIDVQLAGVGTAPEGATDIAFVSSATVGEQIAYMLRNSDNTMAEQYCHLAAQKAGAETTFAGATANVLSGLVELGVNTEGIVLKDCSGLDENSKINASQLVEALQVSVTEGSSAQSLIRLLPRAGIDGTLAQRMTDDGSWGNVQAKTGSLGKASTLTGILTTESGQTLLYAVGYDEADDNSAYYGRTYIDDFISSLANS